MKPTAAFVHHPDSLTYKFNDHHPFNPIRLDITLQLLQQIQALPKEAIVVPEAASDEHILQVHRSDYVQAVQALGGQAENPDNLDPSQYGLGLGDTPAFPNMHYSSSVIAGGSMKAADLVMRGKVKRALHLAGGLHHALPHKAGGFCIYNDAAIAISHIRRKYNAKVLYIDTDVHHGDGVQWMFYTDPDVCTLSIHETGKYLYPGTGAIGERGDGEGFGTSINLPMEPYTEDDSWMHCFKEAVESVTARFKPDIIISQHGCDAHRFDPMAHLHCSMSIYLEMPLLLRELTERWCDGRWVALGGGGYDIWRVVPRAWSLLWLILTDHPLVAELQAQPDISLPKDWIQSVQPHSTAVLPRHWLDNKKAWEPIPRRDEISKINEQNLRLALMYL